MNSQTATRLFESLASGIRLDVFRLLVRYGHSGRVAGEIASTLQVPPNNLSFHLKALTHAGLVTATPEGRFVRYRANLPLIRELVGYLTDECCSADPDCCAPAQPGLSCAPAPGPVSPTDPL